MQTIIQNCLWVVGGAALSMILIWMGLPWWVTIIVVVLGVSAWETMEKQRAAELLAILAEQADREAMEKAIKDGQKQWNG